MKHTNMQKNAAWILCLLATLIIRPAAQVESDAAKVRGFENQLMNSYKQREVKLLASLLDEDFVITFEDGSTYSKTGYISYSAAPSVRIDVAEMSDVKTRMHGDTAILTGEYHERGEDKGKSYEFNDRFTDVWIKKGGKWLLVASHYGVPFKK